MRDLPKPIVAAVNGVAAGGGANLALACDIVIAARSARFDQAFVRISLIPDLGGTWFLPHTVGDARARALAMLGTSVPAEEAARMGMVWQVVDDAALMDEAGKIARKLADRPDPLLCRHQGRHQRAPPPTRSTSSSTSSATTSASSASSEDFKEGVAAFLAKRAAQLHRTLRDETDDLREDPDRQGQTASPR